MQLRGTTVAQLIGQLPEEWAHEAAGEDTDLRRCFERWLAQGRVEPFMVLFEALLRENAEHSDELPSPVTEQGFDTIFHASPTAMAITRTRDGRFVAVNDSSLLLFGYTRDEILERSGVELGLFDPATRESVRQVMATQGHVRDFEVQVRTRSGTLRDLLLSVEPIEFDGEACELTTSIDITESRRAQAQLLQAQKLEALGRLAGRVAHDFNNLLTAINGYSELALNGITPSHPLYEFLREINTAGERAASLTQQLLIQKRLQLPPTTA